MIPDVAHWSLFLAAMAVLLAVPGPSVMYVLTQAVDHGYRGALLASIGLAAADLLQAVLTAGGLSGVLVSSPSVFQAVRYAGAVYLIFLGIRRFYTIDPPAGGAEPRQRPRDAERAFSLIGRAFFALNPKTTLFFLALFPQVVDVRGGAVWLQMLEFGVAFALIGSLTNFVYGCIGRRFVLGMVDSSRVRSAARYATAGTLIGLGVAAVIVG